MGSTNMIMVMSTLANGRTTYFMEKDHIYSLTDSCFKDNSGEAKAIKEHISIKMVISTVDNSLIH